MRTKLFSSGRPGHALWFELFCQVSSESESPSPPTPKNTFRLADPQGKPCIPEAFATQNLMMIMFGVNNGLHVVGDVHGHTI